MTFNKTLLTATLLTVGGFAAMSSANAAETDTFEVKMNIAASCDIQASAADIDFGTKTSGETDLAGQSAAITVNCTNLTPYDIALVTTSDATTGTGIMLGGVGGNEEIPYALFSDAASTVWGATKGTNTVNGVGDGMLTPAKEHIVYAKVAATDVSIGDYVDTVTVNVLY